MKSLNNTQKNNLYEKRKQYTLSVNELATILNCKEKHIIDAQLGKAIPIEVYDSVINWIS